MSVKSSKKLGEERVEKGQRRVSQEWRALPRLPAIRQRALVARPLLTAPRASRRKSSGRRSHPQAKPSSPGCSLQDSGVSAILRAELSLCKLSQKGLTGRKAQTRFALLLLMSTISCGGCHSLQGRVPDADAAAQAELSKEATTPLGDVFHHSALKWRKVGNGHFSCWHYYLITE